MLRQKVRNRRTHLRKRKRHAAGQPQLTAQRALGGGGGFFFQVLRQRQHLLAAAQRVFARVGQRHAAGGALQQAGL
ncbi:hypothetical protein D3C72_2397870 [compost metagenome]